MYRRYGLQLRCEATDDDGSCDWAVLDGSVSSDYSMTVEVYGEDLLAGHTTYRFYMNVANEDDFSSIYGTTSMPSA